VEPTAPPIGQCANPYQPVVIGARWDYAMSGITTGTFTRSITDVRMDGFTEQDIFDTGVGRTAEWRCEQGILTALSPAEGLSALVQSGNMSAEFKTTSATGVTLPATIRSGDSWSQTFTVEGDQQVAGQDAQGKGDVAYSCNAAGTETVMVAAGAFEALRVGCRINATITVTMSGVALPTEMASAATIWYARDVGMVKTENEVSGLGHSTIELTSYTIP
jgi:hypothetical protein